MKWLLHHLAEFWLIGFGLLSLLMMLFAFSICKAAAKQPPLHPDDQQEFRDHDV